MGDVVTIGSATLYHGDCLEVMANFPPCFRVDALITDPPYGVDFVGKKTKHTRAPAGGYIGGDSDIGPVVVADALRLVDRGLVFCGTRKLFSYPQPYDIGCVYCPSGAGNGRWGFSVYHPILYYGQALAHGIRGPSGFESFALSDETRHPCTKPIQWMNWSVAKCTTPGQTVIDPFMGSGTTGVACANLGRQFIGIEIERKYFDIACERITAAYAQGRLFA